MIVLKEMYKFSQEFKEDIQKWIAMHNPAKGDCNYNFYVKDYRFVIHITSTDIEFIMSNAEVDIGCISFIDFDLGIGRNAIIFSNPEETLLKISPRGCTAIEIHEGNLSSYNPDYCYKLDYPIQDDQYFQINTAFPLEEESFYDMMIEDSKSYDVDLYSLGCKTFTENGLHNIKSALDNDSFCKAAHNSMELLMVAYSTAKENV